MFKAVFIDVDGTLIRKDHTISSGTFNIIQKLIQNKLLVVLVSARPLSAIEPVAEKLNLLKHPLASLNGSYISYNNEIIFNSIIDLDITKKLYKAVQGFDTTIIYYQQNRWFSKMQNINTNHEQKITTVPIIFQPFETTFQYWEDQQTGPNKILIITEEAAVKQMQDDLRKQFSDQVNIDTSKSTYLEIINKPASKRNAVEFLIKQFKIPKEETIAIGDNFNDKEMIEFAGMGIAMGNAPDEVKLVANFVTDTNDNDGVSKALENIMGL